MQKDSDYSPAAFLAWLNGKIDAVNDLEAQGSAAVARGDQAGYSAVMRRKAMLLAALEEEAEPYLEGLENPDSAEFAGSALDSFAFNASRALEIGSVFFMSALLFPDDHQAGEPSNLELFRDALKKRLGL